MGGIPVLWRMVLVLSVLLFASGAGIVVASVAAGTAIVPARVPVALILAGVLGVLHVRRRWRRA
jgi:hypothetical protein